MLWGGAWPNILLLTTNRLCHIYNIGCHFGRNCPWAIKRSSSYPGHGFWRFMNPGPFNIKEHVAITIFSMTVTELALAIRIFAADELYYNLEPNIGVGIFTLIGTLKSSLSLITLGLTGSRLMVYGLGGIMRAFLVYPTYIVFPNILPTVQLFDALHRGEKIFLQKK